VKPLAREGFVGLRAVAWALACVVVTRSLTVPAGSVAAALGAIAGVLLAERAQSTARGPRLRPRAALAASIVAAGFGEALARLLAAWPAWTSVLGIEAAVAGFEAVRAFAWSIAGVFLVRTLARRSASGAVFEVATVAASFALAFAAHRGGQVQRPLALGDWAWSHGIDPALVFLWLGVGATLFLAALLVGERRGRRLPVHGLALLLIGAAIVLGLRVVGLPTASTAGALGLTGHAQPSDEAEAGEEAGRKGEPPPSSMPLDELRFDSDFSNEAAQAPMAIVLLHDDYDPPSGVYYFRQAAFSQFNGDRLVASTGGWDDDVLRGFPSGPRDLPHALPATAGRKALATSFGLLVDHVRPFALDTPAHIEPRAVMEDFRFQRTYHVVSNVQERDYASLLGSPAGNPDWSPEEWANYTRGPDDPRYARLAREIVAGLRPEYRGDALAEAIAIKNRLDESGTYSLKSGHAGGPDPTGDFLFGDRVGYCVHFAHAATYLFRSLGLPARVTTGYAVPADARAGGSAVLIRGGDAHAWPELYLQGVGWVVVDLAPENALDGGMAAVDPALQRLLGEMLREQLRDVPFDELGSRWTPADLARWLRWVALAIASGCFALKAYRRWVPRFAPSRHLPRLAYRAALDRLAGLGLRRRHGETREAFARRVAPWVPSFATLTGVHLRAAFGAGAGVRPEAFRSLDREIGRELTRLPRWRRWLGALDPTPWMRVR